MIATTRRSVYALASVVLAAMLIAGCASQPTRQPTNEGGNQYATDESMIVPDSNSALAQGLRRALAERGWHLVGYSGDMISGHADYQAMARQAKYRLTLMGTPVGQCRNGDQSFLYRIAIIRNDGGDVPVAMSGADCLTPVVAEFADDLDQKQLAPVPHQPTPADNGDQ